MFNCTSKTKSTKFSIITTQTQKVMEDISDSRRNRKLQFLILLPEDDYKKCIYSVADMLWYRKSSFPGELTIEKYEDSDQLPYTIEEPVMPRQLYIMLPKEKTFIPSNKFTERYIRSKMRELLSIFVQLGAKTIKFTRYDHENETENASIDMTVDVPRLSISQGIKLENSQTSKIGFQYEMKFDKRDNDTDIQAFCDPKSFYYLSREPTWQHIIIRKMDGNMTYDKYSYCNKEMKLLKNKFVQKLNFLNLSAEYDWERMREFCIDYEIEYHEK